MHPCGSACRMAMLLLLASKLGFLTCEASRSSFSFIEVDSASEVSFGQLGEIEMIAPAATPDKIDDESLRPLQQPFEVVLGAKLYPGTDYSDWAMCYAVFAHNTTVPGNTLPTTSASGAGKSSVATTESNGAPARVKPVLKPHCVAFSVVGDGVKFDPIGNPTPPLFDALSTSMPYSAVGWFESRSAPSRKWAVQERKFTVQRPIPKHSDGRAHFLVTDSGVPEFEDDVLLIDGEIRVSQNPLTHASFKTTPTVCGAAVATEKHQITKLAHAIEHVITKLPMVRPIHLYHAPSLLDECSSSNGGGESSPVNEGEEHSANSESGWAFSLGPLSFAWKQNDVSVHASGTSSQTMNGGRGGGNNEEKAAQSFLCHLVESEAIVPHALTVESLAASERGSLLKSRVFWSRLGGSDRVLLFDSDSTSTATNNGGCRPSVKVPSATLQQPSGNYSAPPKLVRDFATKYDFVNLPGIAAGDEAGSSSDSGVGSGMGAQLNGESINTGQWSLRNVNMAASCAADYGHLVGSEEEGHFFERCVVARGGRVANATHHDRFRAAVC